jgi:hypothetical protein
MQQRTRTILGGILGLAIVVVCAGTLLFAARAIWRVLVGVNSQLAVALITAGTTVLVATITVMLGRYYERKRDIEAQFRTEKIKIYDQFLCDLFKTFHDGTNADSIDVVAFLREWQRKLVLWGGPDVLRTYFRWVVRLKRKIPDAQTMFLMDEFFRALRSDIGQSSRGLDQGSFAHLVLRHGEFFLQQAKQNPSLTLAELGRLEEEHFGPDAG